MTRYLKIYNDVDVNINIVFGKEVGAWVEGRNTRNLQIGKELIHKMQKKTRHNRRKMCNPYKWRSIIEDCMLKYPELKLEEKVVV